MSKVFYGWFTHGSTTTNLNLSIPGFTHIDAFEITLGPPSATPSVNNKLLHSVCKTGDNPNIPGNASSCLSTLIDGGNIITRLSETYCVQHYDLDPSTSLTRRVISGTLVGYSIVAGSSNIEIDYDRASTDYKQYITVWGS